MDKNLHQTRTPYRIYKLYTQELAGLISPRISQAVGQKIAEVFIVERKVDSDQGILLCLGAQWRVERIADSAGPDKTVFLIFTFTYLQIQQRIPGIAALVT